MDHNTAEETRFLNINFLLHNHLEAILSKLFSMFQQYSLIDLILDWATLSDQFTAFCINTRESCTLFFLCHLNFWQENFSWNDGLCYLSTSEASISAVGMLDKDSEHAQIMPRLDKLEMEEKEAGSASEEEDDNAGDEGDGTSEDSEENEESGYALSDNSVHVSSDSGAPFSGSGGNDKSHGKIRLKSALKKTGIEEMPGSVSHTPSAHTSDTVFSRQTSFGLQRKISSILLSKMANSLYKVGIYH